VANGGEMSAAIAANVLAARATLFLGSDWRAMSTFLLSAACWLWGGYD